MLSFSNTVSSPAATALNNKSQLNLSNLGMPAVSGITNQNVLPPALRTPTAAVKAPAAPAASSSGSLGSYKGVSIMPGSDVAGQIAKIDGNSGSTASGTDSSGLLASLQKQLADKQSELAAQTAMQKQTGSSSGTPATPAAPAQPSYNGLITSLANTAQNGTQQVTDANKALVGFRTNAANYIAGVNSAPTSARVMQGRDQAVQLANAQTDAALSTGVQNALTGQGQQITGLNQAATLASPANMNVQVPYNNQYINGQTGLPVNPAANQSMNDAVALQVQRVLSNGSSVADASQALSAYGQAGQNALQQALGGNFNVNTNAGLSAAQQSNSQVTGTTNTNIAASGLTDAVHDYQNMFQANSTADAQATQVKNILASTGLNSGVQDFNKAINSLGARLGSANVTALTTGIVELQNAYSQLLNTSGNTPSGAEAQALAVLNPNSSASQITAAISVLQNAASNKLTSAQAKAASYNSNLNGGGSSTSGGSTGGGVVQTKVGAINTNW